MQSRAIVVLLALAFLTSTMAYTAAAQVTTCPPDMFYDPVTFTCLPLVPPPAPSTVAPPPTTISCPAGMFYDPATFTCLPVLVPPPTTPSVPPPAMTCPAGMFWDPAIMVCMPIQSPMPGISTSGAPMPSASMPPPPSCPAGMYWDYALLVCMPGASGPPPSGSSYPPPSGSPTMYPSGTYQAPPSCAAGQYWDYQKQTCTSGAPPPPPGCTADGYCPPPPQTSCAPGDPYCRPPPPPECGQKMESLRPQFESLFKEFQTRMESFHQQFESARREFGQSQHSSEEWRAWGEDWRLKGESLGKEFADKMNSFVASNNLGPCAQYLPPPPIMMGGTMGGAPTDMGPRQYEQMKQPPEGNRFQQEDEEVRQIRLACEAEAKQILGEFWREPGQGPPPLNFQGPSAPFPSGSPFPGAPSMPPGPADGPSREQMEQVHQIMRECEQRIRAHFEEVYQEEGLDESADQGFGSFEMYFDEATGQIHVNGKYLSLIGNPESQVLSDITCGGQSFIDQLYANGFLENFDFEQTGQGTALRVKASGTTILQLHDNPRCAINLATGGTVTELTLDLADYLDVEEGENGVSFTDGETDGVVLLHDGDLELGDDNVLTLHSKATFLVSNSAGAEAGASNLAKDLNVKKALEDGQIGAEIQLVGDGDDYQSDSTPYGDMDIDVEKDEDTITIDLDKEEPAGKTIVVGVDEDVMTIEDFDSVDVAMYEIVDPENPEAFCAQEASDLQDVLDPTDDGDCAEYWIVLDRNGAQVLVSIPHFSAKRVEIQSTGANAGVGGLFDLPSPGVVGAILAAGAALALVGVGLRRRA